MAITTPVVVTTLFAPFGGAAPALWLLVARAGGLMAESMSGDVVIASPSGPHAAARPRVGADYAVVARSGGVSVLSRCAP